MRQHVRRGVGEDLAVVLLPLENYTYAADVTRRGRRRGGAKEKEAQRVTTALTEAAAAAAAARGDCGYLENRLDGK